MDHNQNNSNFSKIIAGLILYSFILIAIFVVNFSVSDFSNDVAKWGAVGDYFGGLLNPILAFFSFIGVLWTLKMSREELVETRKVLNEQLKTQNFQQADNFFAIMFEKILSVQPQTLEASKRIGSSLIDKRDLDSLRVEIRNKKVLIRYFRLLFQTFFMLKQILKDQDNEKLNSYIKIVRSQQEDKVLELLFIYISENKGEPTEFHSFLKSSNFFKHLKLDATTLSFYEVIEAYKDFQMVGKDEFFKKPK